MRTTIILTADDGKTYQAEVELLPQNDPSTTAQLNISGEGEAGGSPSRQIDLKLALRPFMKRYRGNLNGSRFVLLVAHLTQEDLTASVSLKEVSRQWNKMKPLMGGAFNAAYSARAREDGWVDTPKVGMYSVCARWKEIFQ